MLLIVSENIHRWCFVLHTKYYLFANNMSKYSFNLLHSILYVDRSSKTLETIEFYSCISCFKGNIITTFT